MAVIAMEQIQDEVSGSLDRRWTVSQLGTDGAWRQGHCISNYQALAMKTMLLTGAMYALCGISPAATRALCAATCRQASTTCMHARQIPFSKTN